MTRLRSSQTIASVMQLFGVPKGLGLATFIVIGASLLADIASAEAALDDSIQTHGFVSQGLIKTTDNNYLAHSERGSFEFTEVGLNFTKQVSDELRMGFQLFARDLGPLGGMTPTFDWFYLDYRFYDWLGLRAGRTKLPFGLYNEVNDIDAARIPILLPQSVYPVASREFLLAQTGAELYGRVPLSEAGALEYRAYAGTIFLDTSNSTSQFRDFEVPYVIGGRLMWQLPVQGLQVGASLQSLRLDFDLVPNAAQTAQFQMEGLLAADFDGVITTRVPARLWVASAEYLVGDLLLASEFSQTYVRLESNLTTPTIETTNTGLHAMASYRVAPWFAPGFYYSALLPNNNTASGSDRYQHDVAVTFRYDLTANWLLKLESHYMHGTAVLSSELNDGAATNTLEEDWVVMLVKTTAYF